MLCCNWGTTYSENGGSLTDHGRKEAEALVHFFCGENEPTHAYSSPMGRARLTAKLALSKIDKFSGDNFDSNVGIEEWSKELSTWRLGRPINGGTNEEVNKAAVGSGKGVALWDIPASTTRSRLVETIEGTSETTPGWTHRCNEHAVHIDKYNDLCSESDDFLAKHGIHRKKGVYYMSKADSSDPSKRLAKIVVFCHGGLGLTWLAHLLHIPLPLIHSSFWLAPSSVTTILFDEWHEEMPNSSDSEEKNDAIILTPRALCVGGTNHLASAGLQTAPSRYEEHLRPSGLKTNYF
mmetsp:Transcript_2463/g.2696  ORF Transcript_2463/g.2696 Transcript_2463/m.2696 type:complete len:293 (+) Transcript_2463:226-1104(+)